MLQPRDYLNSFLLYAMMLGGFFGLIFTNPTIEMPAIGVFHHAQLGYLFPILFVTIACGAISGFHSLVASGTTSKQLDKETDAKIVGFGGMLIEVMLAALALAAVVSFSSERYAAAMGPKGGNAIKVFGEAIGGFMVTIGVPMDVGTVFVSLAVSAFALTSLDTCARLARFIFQEFFAVRHGAGAHEIPHEEADDAAGAAPFAEPKLAPWRMIFRNRFVATIIPVAAGGALTLSGQFGQIWPTFGSANQMLAALALCAGAVWLSRKGIKNLFLLVPMGFMFLVTLSALVALFIENLNKQNWVLCTLAAILFALAVVLLIQSINVLRRPANSALATATDSTAVSPAVAMAGTSPDS